MKIAIVGGSGFIGTHTARAMQQSGYDITVIDKCQPSIDVNYVRVDILDHDKCLQYIKGFDYVYHLAAISDADENRKDPIGSIAVNIQGLTNVLNSCVSNNIQRVIFSSSVWVYSAANVVDVDEETSLDINKVNHIYTASKLAGEALIRSFTNLYGLDHTILRYGIAYGPGQTAPTAIVQFMNNAINKEPMIIYGDGSYHRNFMYVTDHARGNICALKDAAKNQTINLEGPEPITINRVANTISNQFGSVEIKRKPARSGDYTGKIVCNEKSKALINWSPTVSFNEGIQLYKHELV
tara:strand:+ start:227 stop:1114 length:888 start_codon:yes stop_codon:yes gene_type:complete